MSRLSERHVERQTREYDERRFHALLLKQHTAAKVLKVEMIQRFCGKAIVAYSVTSQGVIMGEYGQARVAIVTATGEIENDVIVAQW